MRDDAAAHEMAVVDNRPEKIDVVNLANLFGPHLAGYWTLEILIPASVVRRSVGHHNPGALRGLLCNLLNDLCGHRTLALFNAAVRNQFFSTPRQLALAVNRIPVDEYHIRRVQL